MGFTPLIAIWSAYCDLRLRKPQRLVESGWFAVMPVLSALGLFGFFFQTRIPPWPALLVIALLAATTMGFDGSARHWSRGAAKRIQCQFILLKHGNGSANLGDLLDGKDTLILGVFTAGSPSADLQMQDFIDVREKLGDSVFFAQMITGESVEIYDGDSHAAVEWILAVDD